MKTTNNYLFDASIRHQIGLYRLGSGEIQKFIPLLEDIEQELQKKLSKKDISLFSYARLNTLIADIRILVNEAYVTLTEQLNTSLLETANYEAEYQHSLLTHTIPVKIKIERPTLGHIKEIVLQTPLQGRFIRDEVQDLSAIHSRRVEQTIRIGILEGLTTSAIIQNLQGTPELGYTDGILNRSYRDIERLVRTSINHVTNRTRNSLYEANTHLIKGWRFTATLDGRTSIICASLDGQIFPIGSGPIPPRHPNCRSTTVPILKSWQEMGLNISELSESTRASLDGQVPESLTYQTWLKQQSREFIEDVLGKTKAALFLEGGLALNRFVDSTGKILNIKELRILESEVFSSV